MRFLDLKIFYTTNDYSLLFLGSNVAQLQSIEQNALLSHKRAQ